MIHVTAAIIIDHRGRILICKRGPGGNCAHLWEFPGGKLEPGETLEECVVRECREELEVEIGVFGIYDEFDFSYPDNELRFTFFTAEIIRGKLNPNVHEEVKWVFHGELSNFEFCPADIIVVDRLMPPVNNLFLTKNE